MPLTTLRSAAARLGITADTLRAQIQRGRLTATKLGRDWLVDDGEVERYRRMSLRAYRRNAKGLEKATNHSGGAPPALGDPGSEPDTTAPSAMAGPGAGTQ